MAQLLFEQPALERRGNFEHIGGGDLGAECLAAGEGGGSLQGGHAHLKRCARWSRARSCWWAVVRGGGHAAETSAVWAWARVGQGPKRRSMASARRPRSVSGTRSSGSGCG